MKDIKYNAANTRIRTYESHLLSDHDFEQLLQVPDAKDIYTRLKETDYGDFIDEDSDVHDFEQVLLAEEKRLYQQMYELAPDPHLVDLFTLKYDYQNLKLLVKADHIQADLSAWLVPVGTSSLEVLKHLVHMRTSDKVAVPMNDCIKEVYEYIENYHEVQDIDIIFDSYYWQHLTMIAQNLDHPSFDSFCQRSIDIFNITTALRSHLLGRRKGFISAVLVDGGTIPPQKITELLGSTLDDLFAYLRQTPYQLLIEASFEEILTQGTMEDFDRYKDDFLMERMKEQKIVPFGPSAMVGYIFAKEIEIKNLRILLISKINKIPDEVVRSKVRESYV